MFAKGARLLLLPWIATALACSSPEPSHLTRLWPSGLTGDPILGLSTQDGILVLSMPEYEVGDVFELHFPVGNSVVRDWGRILRMNEELAVVHPLTARVMEGRIATRLPDEKETLYLALRDEDDEPVMTEVERWRNGAYGDYVVLSGHDADAIARDWAGAGLYVRRESRAGYDDRWEIVGILAGITARLEGNGDVGLGYIGVLEMARILPDLEDYFQHGVRPLRPDFEFGVPLQPGDIPLEPEELSTGGTSSSGR